MIADVEIGRRMERVTRDGAGDDLAREELAYGEADDREQASEMASAATPKQ